MVLTLDSFRSVASLGDRGYMKADADETLKQFGESRVFGKIARVASAPSETANVALRQTFITLLKAEYGPTIGAFLAAKFDAASGKPISLAEVKAALLEGDAKLVARREIIDTAASRFVQSMGLVADSSKGVAVPGLQDAIGPELTRMIADLNGRAAALDTGIALGPLDVLPRDMRQRVDARIHEAIVAAHGDPQNAKALSRDAVTNIIARAIKDDPEIQEMASRKAALLLELDKLPLTGAERDYATADLLRGNDRSIQDLMVRSGRAAPGPKGDAQMKAPSGRQNIANASIDRALDPNAATGPKPTGEPGDFFSALQLPVRTRAADREFHINREVLGHFANKVKDQNPELAKALGQRALGHLIRFAVAKGAEDTRAENPLVGNGLGNYSRSGGTSLTGALTNQVAESLGVPAENVLPVTDGRIMEVVKRDLATKDMNAVFTLGSGGPDQEGALLFDIVGSALAGNKPVFVDVTAFMAGTLHGHKHDLDEMRTAIEIGRGFLADVIKGTVAEYVEQHNATHAEKLDLNQALATVSQRLTLGSMISVGGQDVLFTDMAAGKQKVAGGTDPKQTMADYLRQMVAHNGFTVGPNQLLENWLSAVTPADDPSGGLASLSKAFLFYDGKIDFSKATGLRNIGDVASLMGGDTGRQFAALRETGSSDAFRTLPSIALAMLQKLEAKGMSAAFQRAGVPELQTYLLNHIESQMQVALDAAAAGNQRGFIEAMELVHADIATMTAVVKPYGPGDFQASMLQQWKAAEMGAPETVMPKFSITNSGMRSLASVLSGIERMLPNGAPLNVAVAKNSYYESAGNLSSGRAHKTFEMSDTNPAGSMPGFDALRGGAEKVNLLVTEFHHNINMGVKDYASVPVADQIKALLSSDVVSDKLTVAIDDTISVPNGDDMKVLLRDPVIAKALAEGRLNIVTYRSAQKFDMGGYDNYNGGIVSVLNNGSFGTFEAGMANVGGEADRISDINYQGLTLFQDAAGKELADYRKGVIANTKVFTALLAPKDLLTDTARGAKFIQYTPNNDPSAVFLDLRSAMFSPKDKVAGDLYAAVQALYLSIGREAGGQFAVATRPSFGFAHSNVTIVDSDRFRFNPGLEKSADMAAHKGVIDGVNLLFEAIEKALPEGGPSGRDPAVQVTEFLHHLTMLSKTTAPQKDLAAVLRGLRPDAGFDDLVIAAGLLKAGGVTNLASALLTRAEGKVANAQHAKDLDQMRQTVGNAPVVSATAYRMAMNSFAQSLANGNADQVELRSQITKLDTMRRSLESNGQSRPVAELVGHIATGMQHLDKDRLTSLADGLGRAAALFGDGESSRVLGQAFADEFRHLAGRKPASPPVTPQTIGANLQAMRVAKGRDAPAHAIGIMTELGQKALDAPTRAQANGADRYPGIFADNPMMQQLAGKIVDAVKLADGLRLSPRGEETVKRISREMGLEFPGLPTNIDNATLSAFVTQSYLRNMQFPIAAIMGSIVSADLATEKGMQKASVSLSKQGNELEKNIVTQSSTITGLSSFLLDGRLHAALGAEDSSAIMAMGRNLLDIANLMNVPGGLADTMREFGRQLRLDPLVVANSVRALAV